MFDIGSSEFLLIVIVAVVVIGPKDLPRALYKVGQIVGKARGMARHFRTGIDAMVREVEMEELERKWADQNRRIMNEHPPESLPASPQMEPLPAPRADPEGGPPPFVPQSAPVAPAAPAVAAKPASAAEGPPYLAARGDQGKGDAPA